MKYKLLKTKAMFQIFLVITLVFFTANVISRDVKAQTDEGENCCRDLGNEQYCQSINNPDGCAEGYAPTSCEYVNGCEQGCCNLIDKGGGCSKGVSQVGCDKQGGKWTNDKFCGYDQECVSGCCVVGSNQAYLTIEDDCDGEFRKEVIDEQGCTDLARRIEEGCCVKEKNCVYETRGECAEEFTNNKYCSDISECKLKKHSYMDCGPGLKEEDVYWYDSGGNPEGLVKNGDSYDNGTVVNIDGDCSYMGGNICRDTNRDGKGDKCAILDCVDTWDNPRVKGDGGLRKNGESWCEYQSQAGPGLDLPGSIHYRHICRNGVEVVESCGSDRGEEGICVYKDLKFSSGDEVSVSGCVDNTWEECIECTSDYCCTDPGKTCYWIAVEDSEDIDGYCVPLVPPENVDYCSYGSIDTIETQWNKPCGGGWECAAGCDAYEDDFLFAGNSFCNVYGNCGAKYNLAGKFSGEGYARTCDDTDCTEQVTEADVSFSDATNAGEGLGMGSEEVDDATCAFCGAKGAVSQYSMYAGLGSFALVTGLHLLGLTGGITSVLSSFLGVGSAASFGSIAPVTAATPATATTPAAEAVAASTFAGVVAIVLVVILVLAIIFFVVMMTCGDTTMRDVSTTCGEWQPPLGGADCWKCSTRMDRNKKGDECTGKGCGLLPYSESFDKGEYSSYECNEQLCKSLGSTCAFEQSKEGPICISQSPTDVNSPVIEHDMTNQDYYCNEEAPGRIGSCNLIDSGNNGFKITNDLIDVYEGSVKDKWPPILLKIKTNEYSTCKYSKNPKDSYDSMVSFFDMEGDVAGMTHNMSFEGLDNGTYKFYIKCMDYLQNKNERPFVIEFNVASQPDMTPPIIEEITPKEGSYVKFGEENVSVTLKINEPFVTSINGSGCKWSKEPNLDYDTMKDYTVCGSSMVKGNRCIGVLNGIKPGENKFYFRCRDKEGNVNAQDWPMRVGAASGYNLYGSKSNLSIKTISCLYNLPDGTQVDDCKEILARNFTLKLITDGGALSGKASCEYNGNKFFKTDSVNHEQCLGCGAGFGLNPGTYNYVFSCNDVAGNHANAMKNIVINSDVIGPVITAVYKDDSGLLNVETNEPSYCRYSINQTFIFNEAKQLSSSDLLKHKVDVQLDFYRIGCKDRFDNYNTPINVYLLSTGKKSNPVNSS